MKPSGNAWQILAWDKHFVSAGELLALAPQMRPMAVSVYWSDDQCTLRNGQILCAAPLNNNVIGLAFEWGDSLAGVPAMSDPMSILSNVVVLDDQGLCMPAEQRVLTLNDMVACMPWQVAIDGLQPHPSLHQDVSGSRREVEILTA